MRPKIIKTHHFQNILTKYFINCLANLYKQQLINPTPISALKCGQNVVTQAQTKKLLNVFNFTFRSPEKIKA